MDSIKADLIFLGLTAVANCVSAFGIIALFRALRVQIRTYSDEYRWRRQNLAIEVLREWNTYTVEYRDRIETYFQKNYGPPPRGSYVHPVDFEIAKNIYHCAANDEDTRQAKRDITRLLNYFEYICAAYEKNAVDRKIIDDSFMHAVLGWYSDLEAYVRYVNEWGYQNGPHDTWPPLRRVVGHWRDEGLDEKGNISTEV